MAVVGVVDSAADAAKAARDFFFFIRCFCFLVALEGGVVVPAVVDSPASVGPAPRFVSSPVASSSGLAPSTSRAVEAASCSAVGVEASSKSCWSSTEAAALGRRDEPP